MKSHLENMGISRLVFAGMMTHMCVDTSVRTAFDLGFSGILGHDACATRSLTFVVFGLLTPPLAARRTGVRRLVLCNLK